MPSPGVQCGTSVLECQSSLLIVRPGSGISEQECLEISQCGAGEAPAGVSQVFLRHGQMGGVQRQWELRLSLSPLASECWGRFPAAHLAFSGTVWGSLDGLWSWEWSQLPPEAAASDPGLSGHPWQRVLGFGTQNFLLLCSLSSSWCQQLQGQMEISC